MLFSRSSEQKAQVKVLDVERSRDCSEDEGVGHTQGTCSRRAGPARVGRRRGQEELTVAGMGLSEGLAITSATPSRSHTGLSQHLTLTHSALYAVPWFTLCRCSNARNRFPEPELFC